ncbi:hypothetical protein BHYA_0298g00080 [Botrytis hyacinthi]|uniref:CPAF-like PDZ domain-containing protein n=1 Tax=Botrytis hyacinthi TaxID=278943 RepID=A0A4Z1GB40_9HELO|nr:hypothetical protein BHYA_0298g00080 [Botrytis hyacinthi]
MNLNIYIKVIFQAIRFIASLFTAACILAIGDAASKTSAASPGQTAQRTHKQSSSPTASTKLAPTDFTNTSSGACASVPVMIRPSPGEPTVAASIALECLQSVPLNFNRSISFIEFIEPYLQFQITLAYLKSPPQGWLFSGVDVLVDLDRTTKAKNATFTPSAIVKINGQDANIFLQKTGQSLSDFNDPDATYNQLFSLRPLMSQAVVMYLMFVKCWGSHPTSTTIHSKHGTTKSVQNVAEAPISFDGIDSGQTLFDALNPLSSTTNDSAVASATSSVLITTTTSLVGYPTPVVIHRDDYISGYSCPTAASLFSLCKVLSIPQKQTPTLHFFNRKS